MLASSPPRGQVTCVARLGISLFNSAMGLRVVDSGLIAAIRLFWKASAYCLYISEAVMGRSVMPANHDDPFRASNPSNVLTWATGSWAVGEIATPPHATPPNRAESTP